MNINSLDIIFFECIMNIFPELLLILRSCTLFVSSIGSKQFFIMTDEESYIILLHSILDYYAVITSYYVQYDFILQFVLQTRMR